MNYRDIYENTGKVSVLGIDPGKKHYGLAIGTLVLDVQSKPLMYLPAIMGNLKQHYMLDKAILRNQVGIVVIGIAYSTFTESVSRSLCISIKARHPLVRIYLFDECNSSILAPRCKKKADRHALSACNIIDWWKLDNITI